MVLVGTLVTVVAPRTAKLAKVEGRIESADAWEGPQRNAARTVSAITHEDKCF
jgi:hypothetical protein